MGLTTLVHVDIHRHMYLLPIKDSKAPVLSPGKQDNNFRESCKFYVKTYYICIKGKNDHQLRLDFVVCFIDQSEITGAARLSVKAPFLTNQPITL